MDRWDATRAMGAKISDFYIFPAFIGAIILVFIVSLIIKSMRKAS